MTTYYHGDVSLVIISALLSASYHTFVSILGFHFVAWSPLPDLHCLLSVVCFLSPGLHLPDLHLPGLHCMGSIAWYPLPGVHCLVNNCFVSTKLCFPDAISLWVNGHRVGHRVGLTQAVCVLYSGESWWALNWWFSQNAIFFNLASFKFGDSRPWPPNLASPLWCKPSLVVQWSSPCSLQSQTERRPWLGCFRRHTFPSLPSLECTCCNLRWDRAQRAYWLQSSSPSAYLASNTKFLSGKRGITNIVFSAEYTAILKYCATRIRMYSSGQPASLNHGDLMLAEFNLAIFP